MQDSRAKIVAWVGSHVLPHEPDVRAWLRRMLHQPDRVEDVLQEAYCRLSAVGDTAHIQSARAYFFQVARNVVLEQLRRDRVVRLESMAELDGLGLVDDEPSPERIVAGRRELERVRELIGQLPDRCRRVFELRKIQGTPQRDIARELGVTEHVVENEVMRGLRLILEAMASGGSIPEQPQRKLKSDGRGAKRRTDR